MQQGRAEEHLISHAATLFGAISVALATMGCGGESGVSAAPSPSASSTASAASVPAEAVPLATVPSASAESAVPSAPPGQAGAQVPLAPSASATARPKAAATAPKRPVDRYDSEGRPFLVDDVARVAALGEGAEWAERIDAGGEGIEPEVRAALVRHFTQWALAEHASIASFARFSLHLLSFGAPAELVERAIAAMQDETRHARLGFGVVTALSGAAVRPAELRIDGALGGTTLEEALRLTVREGVIGETLAALEARLAAEVVSIPSMKEPIRRLAEDESRHAALAYAFAAWAVSRAPELVRVVEEEVADWQSPALEVVSGLEAWGVLDTSARRAAHREGMARVVRPLARRVAGGGDHARRELRC